MIYHERWPFPSTILEQAPRCGEISRVRASLGDLIKAAKAYAAAHGLIDNGSVILGVAPL